ncbi:MAG: tetratricopeptide repeat protein, partial [Terriglobia bacterium]
ATREKPNFALADDVLAELYLRSGQPRRAVAVSRLALKANPDDQAALYHLIVCLRKEGHRKEVPPMVQRLAQVTAAAERREAALSRYRLVEDGSAHARPAP